jgi:cytoplasmic iron level regulating protein YaaA (DUF328/UPF0246 family)
MADQTKKPPFVPLNAKTYEQMKANAPSFSQSMLNVTAHMVQNQLSSLSQAQDSLLIIKVNHFKRWTRKKLTKIVAE